MYRAFNDCICLLKQLTEEYPEILTPDNVWIIGITQEPSTREYYLVFYHDEISPILGRVIRQYDDVKYMQYNDFYELKEIGSGGYRTVYTAKYKEYIYSSGPETVVLKRFKSSDETPELFINEVSNNNR